jgi:hypothetical protein
MVTASLGGYAYAIGALVFAPSDSNILVSRDDGGNFANERPSANVWRLDDSSAPQKSLEERFLLSLQSPTFSHSGEMVVYAVDGYA